MKTVNVDLTKTDWALLRKQKQNLLDLDFVRANGKKPRVKETDLLDGLLNFIDCIQDEAAEQIGEETVFGKDKS
jgi:hypothetical protein